MKKQYLRILPVLLIGTLIGYAVGRRPSIKTNDSVDQDVEVVGCNDDCELYVYEKTTEDTDSVFFDLNNDGDDELVKLISTDCYRSDKNGDSSPIGCAGPACLKPDKYCDGSYKEIRFYDPPLGMIVSSGEIHIDGFGSGQIEIINFKGENFIELGNLNLGAHSSETRVFKIVKNKIEPVCRKQPNLRDEMVDNCVFYSDAGGANLEVHDNSLMVSEFFKTDSVMNMVDGVLSSGGITSIYKNGQFVTQK